MGMQRDGAVGTGDPDRDAAVIAYFGDGASSQGDVNEAFIFAASSTPRSCSSARTTSGRSPSRSSGRPGSRCTSARSASASPASGSTATTCSRVHAVTQAALQRARDGSGPTLVEAYTYRMGAHTTTDDPTRYRLSEDLETWKLKDPIARVKAYLTRNGAGGRGLLRRHRRRGRAARRAPPRGLPGAARAERPRHLRPGLRRADPRARRAAGRLRRLPRLLRRLDRERTDEQDHAGQGPERRPAPGDGGRPQGPRDGRGRRQARRRLPDHRRAAEGLRRGPGDRHPARGVRASSAPRSGWRCAATARSARSSSTGSSTRPTTRSSARSRRSTSAARASSRCRS